ncbi:carbon monoxide dehydrogenase subunit G [Nocardia tenerifensis]|uniref:Carbon monoxide dehydrogenase subunit G n=1 Tax=Nocardia tenerifensis TaxID=228006 RepID=A0A318KPE1_9NOCA|nr:SRPBCC family protein [Nocardia tenerifensis]PXX71550.1 carbon monoxide dehydrogenase subunit G [Nocardia tenerifensis]
MSGHVDIVVTVRAPLDEVWAFSTDPSRWARSGHPVQDFRTDGARSTFTVEMPLTVVDRTLRYRVERVADEAAKSVYSRQFDSPDLRYGHVLFLYTPTGVGTQLRYICDFEVMPSAPITDEQLVGELTRGMCRNLAATADRIEGRTTEGNTDV